MADFGSVASYQGSSSGLNLNRVIVDGGGDVVDEPVYVLMSNVSALTLNDTNQLLTFNAQYLLNAGQSSGQNFTVFKRGYYTVQLLLQLQFPLGAAYFNPIVRVTVNFVEVCKFEYNLFSSGESVQTLCCNCMLFLNTNDVVRVSASEAFGFVTLDTTHSNFYNSLSIVRIMGS